MLRHRRGLFAKNRFLINGLGLAGLLVLGGCDVDEPDPASDGGVEPGSCEDGIDNDCDGLIDGDDPTCQIDRVEDGRCEPDAGAGGMGGAGGGAGGMGGEGSMGGAGGMGGEGGAVAPTCSDALQNGDETGVDCGGACPACPPPPECVDNDDCQNGTCGPEGTCVCSMGYEKRDGVCVDIDECLAMPCHATEVCTNTPGSFECACPLGGVNAGDGCAFPQSCAAIKRAVPDAGDGQYLIDVRGSVIEVTCDMATDGGVGYTMLRIEDDALVAGEGAQGAYFGACAARGMEIVVPRSPNHMESLVNFNGGLLNIVGVYPDFDGAQGLNHFSGRCQGQPCDFWLSDTNNASCAEGGFEPNGNNTVQSALIRQAFAECGFGTWDDQGESVEIGGFVVCSTNDAGPVHPRTCLDAARREIRINAGGEGAEPQSGLGVYTLDSDGPGPLAPYQAWCEGEWTLVLKTAADSALRFDHPAWTGLDDLNVQSADLSPADARLPSYAQVPVGSVMLRLGDYFVTADLAGGAPSMQALMAGPFVATEIGRDPWLAMVADRRGGLQAHCNLEGFNAGDPGGSQVRFGILANNEMECRSSDSFIGIGHTGNGPCDNRMIFSGNNAAPLCGGGEVSHALSGLLFVREPDPVP